MEENVTLEAKQTIPTISPEQLAYIDKLRIQEQQQEEAKKLEQKFEAVKAEYVNDPTKKKIWDAGFGEALTLNKDMLGNESKLTENLKYFSQKAVDLMQQKPVEQPVTEPLTEPNHQSASASAPGQEKKLITSAREEGFFAKDNIETLKENGQISENTYLTFGLLGIVK